MRSEEEILEETDRAYYGELSKGKNLVCPHHKKPALIRDFHGYWHCIDCLRELADRRWPDYDQKPAMRTETEIRARRSVFLEALAETYGKDQPFNEERVKARIEEDEWVLNDKGEK